VVSDWTFLGSSPFSSVGVSEMGVGVVAGEEDVGAGDCVIIDSEGRELVTGSRCVLTSGIISLGCRD
jgi:hypothetical protein